jgi:hypothetical protein
MSVSAEAIIRAALERGELDDLPYKGERIPLDEDQGVHPEDRLAFKVLKNANMVPPEVAAMRDISALREQLAATADPEERRRIGVEIAQKDAVLRLKMERNARR